MVTILVIQLAYRKYLMTSSQFVCDQPKLPEDFIKMNDILARALYTNTPEAKNELYFRKGDIVTVQQFDYEGQLGWWFCSLRGKTGLCPGNYFQVIKDLPIYSNDYNNKEDEDQTTYDVPRPHCTPAIVEPPSRIQMQIQTQCDEYDIPPSEKSFDNDTKSNSSRSNGQSVVSISSETSHYSSSSSGSASARSSEIGFNVNINDHSNSHIADRESPANSSNWRKSEVTEDGELYDIPRPSCLSSMATSQFSKSTKDSTDDIYDVPRSVDKDERLSGETQGSPGLITRVQLRNKTNANTAQNRRAQFMGNGIARTETLPGSRLLFRSTDSDANSCTGSFDHQIHSQLHPKAPSICSTSSDTISISSAGNYQNSNAKGKNYRDSISSMVTRQESLQIHVKTLPFSPKAAISVIEKMQQEVITGFNTVLLFVRPNWRSKANLIEIMPDLRFGCIRLQLGIKDFTEFTSCSVTNAKKSGNEIIIAKLKRLLQPVRSSSQTIQQCVDELEAYFWSPERLSMSELEETSSSDALNHLVSCARNLNHHVTELVNYLRLHVMKLFEYQISVEAATASTSLDPPDDSDYDYVILNSKFHPLRNTNSTPTSKLSPQDSQLLEFYSVHISSIGPILSNSISTFISSIQINEPPKVFNGHLKYVILLAYKLLFAGDTVHRNVVNIEVKQQVVAKSDLLHKSVVELHDMSKIAAQHYPKIIPMENIIDAIWVTTAAANELKNVVCRCAEL